MLEPKNAALVLSLADQLIKHGSWCGETHLQKAMFFLDKYCSVPMEFEFVLYKHGPYSFDLHEKLSSLFALCLVENEIQPPYGPRIRLTSSGREYLAKHAGQLDGVDAKIHSVAAGFGKRGVMELEKLATALWVRLEMPQASSREKAVRINAIKPHISVEEAEDALRQLESLMN